MMNIIVGPLWVVGRFSLHLRKIRPIHEAVYPKS